MGLDVSAYKKLTKLDVLFDEDGEPVNPTTRESIDDYVKVWENPDFPGRAQGLESGCAYAYQDSMGGWSGGYGRYNAWRETLAKLAGFPAVPHTVYGTTNLSHAAAAWSGAVSSGPFWELVNFSDCEGTIGPVVAAKLAADFATHDEAAKALGDEGWYAKYQQWREVFEFAADGGAVCFH